jgi:hypothetical protein
MTRGVEGPLPLVQNGGSGAPHFKNPLLVASDYLRKDEALAAERPHFSKTARSGTPPSLAILEGGHPSHLRDEGLFSILV